MIVGGTWIILYRNSDLSGGTLTGGEAASFSRRPPQIVQNTAFAAISAPQYVQ
jgi:hypothetical protein